MVADSEQASASGARDAVKFSCSGVTFTFTGFPDARNNTVREVIYVDGEPFVGAQAGFDGPSGSNTVKLRVPLGHHRMDARAQWDTNGARGGHDQPLTGGPIMCVAEPAFAIRKLQKVHSGEQGFTPSQLAGEVGQRIDYEIVLTNTGNVPIAFGALHEPRCDHGTLTGGPGSGPLPPGAQATYLCDHVLSALDGTAGVYPNTVTLTGTPTEGGDPLTTEVSNTVVVHVEPPHDPPPPPPPPPHTPPAPPLPWPLPDPPGSSLLRAQPAIAPADSREAFAPQARAAHSGILPLASSAPALTGPQGCVQSTFLAGIRAAGVSRVTFSLDGHRLKTLTARDARGGMLSVTIASRPLATGPHRLGAKITLDRSSSSSRPLTASRTLTVVRCGSSTLTPRFTG